MLLFFSGGGGCCLLLFFVFVFIVGVAYVSFFSVGGIIFTGHHRERSRSSGDKYTD